MNKKLVIIFLVAMAVTFFLGRTFFVRNPSMADSSSLLVGTSPDYQPFCFVENGTIVGFDIDLINEVGRRLGKSVILKDMAFDVLLLELQRGTVQAVAAGLAATDERRKKVFFTQDYLHSDPLVALTKPEFPETITKFSDLIGKKVLVNEGYTTDALLSAIEGIMLERVETVAQAIFSLQKDKAQVFVVSQNAYRPYTKIAGAIKFKEHVLAGTEESSALAVSKKYPELLKEIEDVLSIMLRDGTIEQLKIKWL